MIFIYMHTQTLTDQTQPTFDIHTLPAPLDDHIAPLAKSPPARLMTPAQPTPTQIQHTPTALTLRMQTVRGAMGEPQPAGFKAPPPHLTDTVTPGTTIPTDTQPAATQTDTTFSAPAPQPLLTDTAAQTQGIFPFVDITPSVFPHYPPDDYWHHNRDPDTYRYPYSPTPSPLH